uniref:FLZ-type domain-containing protein n=1 Tax=Kalanchoe fedtschenkoi TaxID=63787 RepID=A0A7N0ZRL0_KALFE
MTVKRMRWARSSRNLLAESSPDSAGEHSDAQPRGKVVKVSPVVEKAIVQAPKPPPPQTEIEGSVESGKRFFEKCFNCETKIGEGDVVFMYSYLRAFCSEDCREDQMEQDRIFGSSS